MLDHPTMHPPIAATPMPPTLGPLRPPSGWSPRAKTRALAPVDRIGAPTIGFVGSRLAGGRARHAVAAHAPAAEPRG